MCKAVEMDMIWLCTLQGLEVLSAGLGTISSCNVATAIACFQRAGRLKPHIHAHHKAELLKYIAGATSVKTMHLLQASVMVRLCHYCVTQQTTSACQKDTCA